jgi:hypothetical protein
MLAFAAKGVKGLPFSLKKKVIKVAGRKGRKNLGSLKGLIFQVKKWR